MDPMGIDHFRSHFLFAHDPSSIFILSYRRMNILGLDLLFVYDVLLVPSAWILFFLGIVDPNP